MERYQAAAQLLLDRRRALADPREFIRLLRREGLPDFDYEPESHHDLLAETFIRLDSDDDGVDRVTVALPPGSAKSFYCSIILPTWLLAKYPNKKILCVSNTEQLAFEHSRRRRQVMMTDAWQGLAGTQLLSDAKSLGTQAVAQGGAIYAVGASGTCTGLRCDWLIADDLITGHEQSANRTQLDKLWNWFISEARSRGRPGHRELLVGTMWSAADPINRAMKLSEQKKEHWEHIRIPMECDDPDTDPLGRKLGERLAPKYFTAEMVRVLKREPLWWQTLYQQQPAVIEGAWVPPEHVHIADKDTLPAWLNYYIGCDIALKVGSGDFTVLAVVGVDHDRNFYLVDLWRKQCDTTESAVALARLCQQYNPKLVFVDDDNSSKVWGQLVAMKAREMGARIPLKLSRMKNRDKSTRAEPLRGLFLNNRFTIAKAAWTHHATNEISTFQAGGRNDDIIDAVGLVPMQMHRLTKPTSSITTRPAPKPIRGALEQRKNGQVVTTQNFNDLWSDNRTLNIGRLNTRI